MNNIKNDYNEFKNNTKTTVNCSYCKFLLQLGYDHVTFICFKDKNNNDIRLNLCWKCKNENLSLDGPPMCAICGGNITIGSNYNYIVEFYNVKQMCIHLLCSEECNDKQKDLAEILQNNGII